MSWRLTSIFVVAFLMFFIQMAQAIEIDMSRRIKQKPPTTDPANDVSVKKQPALTDFIKTFDNTNKTVLMLDADLYSATLYTLASFAPYLKKGDIIFFDEFVVPTHEFMAYENFIKAWYFDLELIGAANNYYFVAFKVV